MKLDIVAATAVVAILPVAAGAGYGNITMPDKAFHLDVEKVSHPLANRRIVPDLGNDLVTRAAQQFADRIDNLRFYYSSKVYIGTPPQAVDLLLDTGSADTWLFTPTTKAANRRNKPKSFFNPGDSKTFRSNNTVYSIKYGIGSSSGQWGRDVFRMGNVAIRDLSMGIADHADVGQGIIGIGRQEAEATYQQGYVYENLPFKLASSGAINTAAYSLYLGDLNAKSGSILFGAVDQSKYRGPLYSMPFAHAKHLAVTLKGFHTDGHDKKNVLKKPAPAVLDSGSSLSYIDGHSLDMIRVALNSNPSFAIGQKYYCDCNVTKHMVLDFAGVQINVPNYHFLWPIESIVNPIVAAVAFPPNSCYIGIEKAQKGMDFLLFGDNFLRAMYLVYDLKNRRVAVAQANLEEGEPRVVVIKDKIPGAIEA